MKNQAKFFEFTSYKLDAKNRSIRFDYKIEFATRAPLFFCEKIILPAPFSISTVPPKFLDTLLSDLHIMLGINYYKLYCPSKVKSSYNLPKGRADFWNAIYKKGLGEFLYRNKIDPEMIAKFPAS